MAEELADRLLIGQIAEFLQIEETPEQDFGPVPIDDERWSAVLLTAAPDAAVELLTHTTYRPVALGRSSLVVTVPATDASEPLFGGESKLFQESLNVDSINVRIEPSDTTLAPGDSATFLVTVENAYFPDSISTSTVQGTLRPVDYWGGARSI